MSLGILHNPQFSTCDEQVLRLLKILQTLATGVPKIILQQLEEIYPALKVSLGVLCVQMRISLSHTHFKLLTPSVEQILNLLHRFKYV